MQVIILCGGFGTRLGHMVKDIPKPMLPIGDKPFLAMVIDKLKSHGVTDILLSVHFQADKIKSYFGTHYNTLTIHYAHEEIPLGTGGAIKYSLQALKPTRPVLVLNGDTFVEADYRAMYQQHLATHSKLTIALRQTDNCERYGRVELAGPLITHFLYPGTKGPGLINAGIYVISPHIFDNIAMPEVFSFEKDYIARHVKAIAPHAFPVNSYFIDIGIPEDYKKACNDLGYSTL